MEIYRTNFNPDEARRLEIIGLNPGNGYDIARFNGLKHEQIQLLLDENFADPDETQNDSPSIQEFLEFLKANPSFRAHGYIVTPRRNDCRVTLEGVELAKGADPSTEEIQAFIDLCHGSDEFTCDLKGKQFYGWWD